MTTNKVFEDALKKFLDEQPEVAEDGARDIGAAISHAFASVGYRLELHQQGIRGTQMLAVPASPYAG